MRVRPVDEALLEEWRGWLQVRLKRFGASGYGELARVSTLADVSHELSSGDVLFSRAIEHGIARGLVVVLHARWEEGVIEQPVAKVILLVADTHDIALALAADVLKACGAVDVVLVSATPGHSPMFIHSALSEVGFHVASQALTVRADLKAIAPAVARIPIRGIFRKATPSDSETIVDIAGRAFVNTRFMSDPYFPVDWGMQLMRSWAENLINGGADEIVVSEAGGKVLGFVTMALEENRRQRVPVLMAVEPRYDGAGIGVMLLRQMLDWYRTRGMKVFVGVTEKSNMAINGLYAQLGFSVLDSNLVYHASPALSPLRERLMK
jgi:GNAT superfamily N-acetyltransferase